MITIISKEKTNGIFHDIETRSHDFVPDGFALVPEELIDKVTQSQGYCDLIFDTDGNLANITPLEIPAPPEPSSAEKRKQAYETLEIIEYNGTKITVDAANIRWWHYEAEGAMDKADNITSLIAAAKKQIREMYPL
jgi:hypothetical protein